MPMNLVIQAKRKELGLTQEQIAEYLNVSIPAVSKWESGATSPDISLLPPLARLLKTDLNTLLCFKEDMSVQEIGRFCTEITNIVQTDGFAEGFEAAQQKIQEYPHNDVLLLQLTMTLDGLLIMSGQSPGETSQYDGVLASWYSKLAESSDGKISNSAKYMLVSRLIRKDDYDKAQEILDSMPDREDIINNMADKLMLQVIIYQNQGMADKAAKDLQSALLTAVNKVQLLLYKLVDAEITAGDIQTAKNIADKSKQMAGLFDLWTYNSFVAHLQVAAAEQNAGGCIGILRNMLEAMLTPWDMGSSPLFHRITKKPSDTGQMLPALLSQIENDPAFDFIRDYDEFKELVSKYKTLVE